MGFEAKNIFERGVLGWYWQSIDTVLFDRVKATAIFGPYLNPYHKNDC